MAINSKMAAAHRHRPAAARTPARASFVGLVYPVLAAVSFDLWSLPLWAKMGFFALTTAACLAGTALGVLIGDRLRAAGVARLARRRPRVMPTA
jgi:energy-coupling factor transport system substrate-specific component